MSRASRLGAATFDGTKPIWGPRALAETKPIWLSVAQRPKERTFDGTKPIRAFENVKELLAKRSQFG
jgi:hypothetical protein